MEPAGRHAEVTIVDALGSALTGLRTAQTQIDTSANDVANLDTPGFRPGASAQGSPSEPSATDLATETGAQITGSIAYAANARVIDVSTQLTKSLIDVLA